MVIFPLKMVDLSIVFRYQDLCSFCFQDLCSFFNMSFRNPTCALSPSHQRLVPASGHQIIMDDDNH